MKVTPLIFLLLLAQQPEDQPRKPPPLPKFGESLGVSIHMVEPDTALLDKARQAGFRWVRTDLTWARVERERGQYDFSAYERLVAEMKRRKLQPLLILDYGNPLYDGGLAPHTDEGRAAFAEFCHQAVRRLKGDVKHWEIWNEPNQAQFWKPQPNAGDYVKLAAAAAKRIRDADREAVIVSGGTARVDLDFLRACFAEGLLEHVDVVSVHPYRQTPPETATPELLALARLIREMRPVPPAVVSRKPRVGEKASPPPPPKEIPIWVGEWGYTTSWEGIDEEAQARYLVRMMLHNASVGIPVSIWYDLQQDGPDPKEGEHNFGILTHADASPRKAALAAAHMASLLGDLEVFRRVELPVPLHGVTFRRGRQEVTAFWAREGSGAVEVAPRDGPLKVLDLYGKELPAPSDSGGSIQLTESPIYVVGRIRVTGTR